jgi:hypothetical protein
LRLDINAITMVDVDPDVPSVKKTPAESALQPTLPLSLPEFKPWSGESTTVWEKIGFSRVNPKPIAEGHDFSHAIHG